MRPVGMTMGSADTEGSEAWDRVVEDYVDVVWTAACGAGLDESEAATVSQLAWLRLAQRWPTVEVRLQASDFGEAVAEELAEWLAETVRSEADALLAQHSARERSGAFRGPNVVCLSPGFAPPEQRSRRP